MWNIRDNYRYYRGAARGRINSAYMALTDPLVAVWHRIRYYKEFRAQ